MHSAPADLSACLSAVPPRLAALLALLARLPHPHHQAYLSRTPILFPLPPAIYRPLPEALKRTFLLDFLFYRFDERVDGPAAVEEETKKLRDREGEDV